MPEIGTLKQVNQGSVNIVSVTAGSVRLMEIATGNVHFDVDPYTGSYEVTPMLTAQTMETKGLRMTDDVTVNPIPITGVTNPTGGLTVTIG